MNCLGMVWECSGKCSRIVFEHCGDVFRKRLGNRFRNGLGNAQEWLGKLAWNCLGNVRDSFGNGLGMAVEVLGFRYCQAIIWEKAWESFQDRCGQCSRMARK